jgi:hypothetical protein
LQFRFLPEEKAFNKRESYTGRRLIRPPKSACYADGMASGKVNKTGAGDPLRDSVEPISSDANMPTRSPCATEDGSAEILPECEAELPASRVRGKSISWNDDENLAVCRAAVAAGSDAIIGNGMSRAEFGRRIFAAILRDPLVPANEGSGVRSGGALDPRRWSGRSAVGAQKQFLKIKAACLSYHACVKRVRSMSLTGAPTENDLMRCALGLYNKSLKISEVYNCIRTPGNGYDVGNDFPFSNCYSYLATHTQYLSETYIQPRIEMSPESGASPDHFKQKDSGLELTCGKLGPFDTRVPVGKERDEECKLSSTESFAVDIEKQISGNLALATHVDEAVVQERECEVSKRPVGRKAAKRQKLSAGCSEAGSSALEESVLQMSSIAKRYYESKLSHASQSSSESTHDKDSRLRELRMQVDLLRDLQVGGLDSGRSNQMEQARLALFDAVINTVSKVPECAKLSEQQGDDDEEE